ncbi:hypothetical protein [Bradyrhizobium sp. MOS003]|nr:hypothetical protein [Bradyrhizobium sp. MOS003]
MNKEAPPPEKKPADEQRTDEARQAVQEHMDDQKAIIKKLRKEH